MEISCLSYGKYVMNLLKEIEMFGCEPVETPIELNHIVGEKKVEMQVDRGRYQRLLIKLIYLSPIRPNIAYDDGVVNQLMHSTWDYHLEVVFFGILHRLKNKSGKEIWFKKSNI